ncbi:hypothetical protein NQ315_001672 [Exocentrus adspersus]|uniref:Uncharacterized protein n=1 Tax=Exocentrus adspersus TaxID=1586481 RepID=A0AAV8W9D3_9CUCU|nr:hypothetical protein NQ315_001672 [Exocentrus adspersus]
MEQIKFTQQQIERFNDRIRNCLEDAQCRRLLEHYLKISRKPVLSNALKLWVAANSTDSFDEDEFLDLIDEVDGFNENPLLTLSECEHKLSYVKMESCRILEKIRPYFIEYISTHHKS